MRTTGNIGTSMVLLQRRRRLLALLQRLGGRVRKRDFQQYLMLHELEYASVQAFDFVPHHQGGFSFLSDADCRSLVANGLLAETEQHWQVISPEDFLGQAKADIRSSLAALLSDFANVKGDDLVRRVYRRFPYYAIRSRIADKLMDESEMGRIRDCIPDFDSPMLFSIGYEGITIDRYLNRLIEHGVKLLCDVRKNPVSRKHGFSKSALKKVLKDVEIEYVHIPALGIDASQRRSLDKQSDYDELFATYEQTTLKHALESLEDIAMMIKRKKRVALTCFEADVCMCHRGRVVNVLSDTLCKGIPIEHI